MFSPLNNGLFELMQVAVVTMNTVDNVVNFLFTIQLMDLPFQVQMKP